jgi:hypothetical protein
VENSTKISLHATDLVATKIMWEEDETLNRQEPIETSYTEKEQLALIFDPYLVPQNGQLRINFRGLINEKKMCGLFRYKSKSIENEQVIVSHFSPLDSRRYNLLLN